MREYVVGALISTRRLRLIEGIHRVVLADSLGMACCSLIVYHFLRKIYARRKADAQMKIIYSDIQKDHKPKWEWNFGRRTPCLEKTSRIRTILSALKKRGFGDNLLQAKCNSDYILRHIHDPKMVRHIRSCRDMPEGETVYAHIFPYRSFDPYPKTDLKRAGYYCFDVGTVINRHTYDAAKSAADTALHGARLIASKKQDKVFCLCRPPGHHADRGMYGGYCYFNNVAVATYELMKMGKVAILDLDFHHGNGTQSIFYDIPSVFFVSIHGDPRNYYPYFAGFRKEKGNGLAAGANLNIPLPPGVDDQEYAKHLDRAIRRIKKWRPHFIAVSMGFDTFLGDPAGDFALSSDFFGEIGNRLSRIGMPVIVCLEGGYSVRQLGTNAANFTEGLARLD